MAKLSHLFRYILIVLLCFANTKMFAQANPFIISSSSIEAGFGENCDYLDDADRLYTIDQVASSSFQESFRKIELSQPAFGYSHSAIWLRCSAQNNVPEEVDFFIEIPYPLLDDIRFFTPGRKGGFQESRSGDNYPFLQRSIVYRNFLFPITIKKNSSLSFYIRVTNGGALNIPLYAWSSDKLIEKIQIDQLILGVFFGIVIVMILYNGFLFSFIRELHYLYYVLFLCGWLLVMGTLNGISFQYLWPNSIWWANYNFPIAIFFTSVWALLFTRSILNTKEFTYFFDRILNSLVYVNAVGIAVPFIVDYIYSLRIALALVCVELVLILIVAIVVYRKEKVPAKYFLWSWTGFLAGILVYQMHSFGWLSQSNGIYWSIHIGASVEVILFALALADRINLIRRENESTQEEVIRMQKIAIENIKTTQKQQEHLIAINQEMKIAREIHQAILPQKIPKLPTLKITVCYEPKEEIGGDLYEFIEEENTGNLGVLVADVTGHGIPAAQVSSMVKAIFTFHKKWISKPDRLLREMNGTLLETHNNQMVTAAYLYIDTKTRLVNYANSGHPPLLVWRKKKMEVESYYPEGKILGWMDDSLNKADSIQLSKGDKIFLFTDGITDVRRSVGEVWGEENFSRFIRDHASLPTDDFVSELLQTLKNFSGLYNGFEDDLTLLILEF
ncbi:7TM diverse intracellular signaling domain-containing protein [Leptospira sp. GIMC2001]|uniref:7TM diverse intracellular signaling domain-containing protein n=1 Tax=Leptospira sp. GIMC2001 TaxID=1513297 RepID=UPI00234B800D|nr:7TM diverse intracellular signaling domain-containing protein [Leptospira sp. GIMC2001]WCL49183.1 SpoIIE family protein phosphatase [Leptospira sp. GIMC2001]